MTAERRDALITTLLRDCSRENVIAAVDGIADKIFEKNAAPLPKGLERFRDDDWQAFAGACNFLDGTDPITDAVPLFFRMDVSEFMDHFELRSKSEWVNLRLIYCCDDDDRLQISLTDQNGTAVNARVRSTYENGLEMVHKITQMAYDKTSPCPASILEILGFQVA